MKHVSHILCIVLAVLLASCGAQKGMKKPKHLTAEVKKAQLHIEMDDKQYDLTASMQTVANSYAVLSITPLLGIEMARVEAMKDSVWVIDKIHRKYAVVPYGQLNLVLTPNVHLRNLEDIVMGTGLKEGEKTQTLRYKALTHTIKVNITYPTIIYDKPMTIRHQDLSRYQRVPIQKLLD
ncbi:MAG: DUF4292 domain-containing protein [Bacteroidales bacterium]|nr:DUF4292 domain-containing protein [Candidatus Colicola coprequi]